MKRRKRKMRMKGEPIENSVKKAEEIAETSSSATK